MMGFLPHIGHWARCFLLFDPGPAAQTSPGSLLTMQNFMLPPSLLSQILPFHEILRGFVCVLESEACYSRTGDLKLYHPVWPGTSF